jgi:hypothetical protein
VVTLRSSVGTASALYGPTSFLFQKHEAPQGPFSFLGSQVVFVDRRHDVPVIELLEFGEHCLFSFVSEFLNALFEVVLCHDDTL